MNVSFRKSKENKFYVLFILSLIICFAVFLSSKLWLYDDDPIRQTPFHTPLMKLSQTEIEIMSWEYNPNKSFMEVVINKKHVGDDHLKPKLLFKAMDLDGREQLDVKSIYETDNMVVVHINNLPDDYRFINLRVIEQRDKEVIRDGKNNQESELKTVTNENNDDQDVEEKMTEIVLFGDYREINTNKSLTERSGSEYEIEGVENDIHQVKKEIEHIKTEDIPLENKLIIEVEQSIIKKEDELDFLTGEEKADFKAEIKRDKGQIKQAIERKEGYDQKLESLEEKVEKYEKKLNKLKGIEDKEKEKEKKKKGNEKS